MLTVKNVHCIWHDSRLPHCLLLKHGLSDTVSPAVTPRGDVLRFRDFFFVCSCTTAVSANDWNDRSSCLVGVRHHFLTLVYCVCVRLLRLDVQDPIATSPNLFHALVAIVPSHPRDTCISHSFVT